MTTVLIIEDEPLLQDLITYALENDGYQIINITTGTEGLAAAQAEPSPDVIILDVQLPGMDGFEIGRILQGEARTANIPIIFLTARTAMKDKLTGFNLGGIDYLTKPFDVAELRARVKATLHRVKIEQDKVRLDLEQYKSSLAQNTSYELLTPLSKVLSALDVLSRDSTQNNPEQLQRMIEVARSGANELHWLIEDLLLTNKLAHEEVKPLLHQKVDLAQAIHLIIEQTTMKYRSENFVFQVKVPEGCAISMHRKHLYHVLHHLLDNACKFSKLSADGGQIKLTVEPLEHGGVEIIIVDKGVGIPSELQEKVFEKYYQPDMSLTRKYEGMGLGLYISRTIAQAYKGDVTLKSQLRVGTTCCFTIPEVG